MNKRDIVIGAVILVILVVVALVLRRPSKTISTDTPIATPSVEQKLESNLKTTIPDDVEKKELSDVAGVGANAIVTRKFENNTFSLNVLADLPDPAEKSNYQVWVTKESLSDEKATFVSVGNLRVVKGGWMLEYKSKNNLTDYKNVLISEEKVSDSKPEKHIMEGSF